MTQETEHKKLEPTLGLWSAVAVNVGAIIGGGIFVVTGIIAGLAGSALVVSMAAAAVVALFTALSFAELTAWHPVEGAVYEYTRRIVSPLAGFLTGWMWIIANTFGGAAVSLGFGYYLASAVPGLPSNIIAAILCLGFTLLNFAGLRQSTFLNNVLVVVKLAVLGFFVVFGLFYFNPANFAPFEPLSGGMLLGMCFIFFAYGGFPRIAVMAEEVKNPKTNVPRAILLSLLISVAVYILVGTIAIGLVGAKALSGSNAPLTVAIAVTQNATAFKVLALGGAVATASVLLAAVLGVSRMAFSMARNKDLPTSMSKVHQRFGTPYVSIWISGAAMAVIVLFADLAGVVAVSTFGLLFGYVFANIAAFKLKTENRVYPKFMPLLGLGTSIMLLAFILWVTPTAWLTGVICLIAGAILYYARKNQLNKQEQTPAHKY
jgi:APA family basic amino acid/polyamine antiporter